jgi:hypothetical protein
MTLRNLLLTAALGLAACSSNDMALSTAPNGPSRRAATAVSFYVTGLTIEHRVSPPSASIASYSGGTIYAQEVSGSTTIALGSVDGNRHPATFTAAAGSSGQLYAVANSGCTFQRWVDIDSNATYTSNPLDIDCPGGEMFRGEFWCYV